MSYFNVIILIDAQEEHVIIIALMHLQIYVVITPRLCHAVAV